MASEKKKVLFVCLGNTCRSPIAEGVFQKTVNDLNVGDDWEIDSAATSDWHVGETPNWRALEVMNNYNVPYNNYAKQIVQEDFNYYDFIFGLDEDIMRDLQMEAPSNCRAKLLLFGDFDPEGDRIFRDPYCDRDRNGFEKCYQQSVRCSRGFLARLDKEENE